MFKLDRRENLWRYFAASAIAGTLFLHGMMKGRTLLPEMLWACHVASFVIAAGILFRMPRLTAAGFLFHAALGFPGYLIDVMATGTTTLTSVFAHIVPLVAAGVDLWGKEFPEGAIFPGFMLYPVLVVVSYWTTDPALNINLAHAPWPPIAVLLPQPWMTWVLNAVVSLFCLVIVERLLKRLFGAALNVNAGERLHV